jgi:exonuclease III
MMEVTITYTIIMALNILSYNCTGLVSDINCHYVKQILNQFDVDIALLQETWLHAGNEN